MAIFDYTTALPQFNSPMTSQRLRTLYGDVKTYLNTLNPQGWVFPNTAASQYQALLFGTGSNFTLNHVIRADGAVQLTNASSLVQGDILYYNGTSLTRLGPGTSGQFLKTNGQELILVGKHQSLSQTVIKVISQWLVVVQAGRLMLVL